MIPDVIWHAHHPDQAHTGEIEGSYDGDVLFTIYPVGNRADGGRTTQPGLPQLFTSFIIKGPEITVKIPVENDSSCGSQHTAGGRPRGLVEEEDLAGFQIDFCQSVGFLQVKSR